MKKNRNILIAIFATAAAATSTSALAWGATTVGEWTYRHTPGSVGAGRALQLQAVMFSKAQLFEEDGKYSFRVQGTGADECFRIESPASVEKTDSTMTIEPHPKLAGCPSVRFVISADGSGGVVQVNMAKRGPAAWATDEDHDYDLKKR